jgi:hypothetical protein
MLQPTLLADSHEREGTMRYWTRTIGFLLLPLVLLAACAGGTSGSIVSSSQSCKTGGGSGSCSGRIGKLTGTYGMDIEDEGIFSGDEVEVEITLSIEVGLVDVSVEDPGGKSYSIEVEPGSEATLLGVSTGEFDGFEITFHAVDGAAQGLSYELIYQTR